MGYGKQLKCKNCGNEWTHFEGVGFKGEPIKGSKSNNITGDADGSIKCPACGSTNFDKEEDVVLLWD